jgi:hypothetical protein
VDLRGRELQLVALEVSEPETRPATVAHDEESNGTGPVDPLLVDVPMAMCTGGLIGTLKQLFTLHRGRLAVVVRVTSDGQRTRVRLSEDYRVDGSPALLAELARLLGPGAARVTVESDPQARPSVVAAPSVQS